MRWFGHGMVMLALVAVLAVPAFADDEQIEFQVDADFDYQAFKGKRKPVRVGAATHPTHGEIVLWCTGAVVKGRHPCRVYKADAAAPASLSDKAKAVGGAASMAAVHVPGGTVVGAALGNAGKGSLGGSGS